MTYAISDLHGRYDLYIKMLEKIGFSEEDTLYILGDFVDRGGEGLKILLDIAGRDNVIGIMGNHDLTSLFILSRLNEGISEDKLSDMRDLITVWRYDGGGETYNEYKSLSDRERRLAIMTMDSLRNYAEIRVGEREFVLCHGGIANYSENTPLSRYTIGDLAFEREDYSKQKFTKKNKFLVTGHTPTTSIEGAEEGRIYRNGDHIAIDCGAAFGYGLGCICLDTMEEFYVK